MRQTQRPLVSRFSGQARHSPALITAPPPSLPCPCPRGEAVIVVHLDRLDPGHSTDAAVTVEALKAEVGSLYRLQILASQLEPQLVCPGERWGKDRVSLLAAGAWDSQEAPGLGPHPMCTLGSQSRCEQDRLTTSRHLRRHSGCVCYCPWPGFRLLGPCSANCTKGGAKVTCQGPEWAQPRCVRPKLSLEAAGCGFNWVHCPCSVESWVSCQHDGLGPAPAAALTPSAYPPGPSPSLSLRENRAACVFHGGPEPGPLLAFPPTWSRVGQTPPRPVWASPALRRQSTGSRGQTSASRETESHSLCPCIIILGEKP